MVLRSGNSIFQLRDSFGEGGDLISNDADIIVQAGNESTDRIALWAGNDGNHGHISIVGDGPLTLNSGNSIFEFQGANGTPESPALTAKMGRDLGLVADRNVIVIFDAQMVGAEAQWYSVISPFFPPRQVAELQGNGDFRIRGAFQGGVTSFDLAESFLATEPVGPGDLVSVARSRSDAVRLSSGEADTAVIGVVSTQPGVVLGGTPFDPQGLREAWGDEVHEAYLAAREDLRARALSGDAKLRHDLETGRPGESGVDLGVQSQAEKRQEGMMDLQTTVERELESRALELFFEERFVPVALAGRVPVKVDAGYGSVRPGDLLTPSPTPGHAMRADDPRPGTVIGKALEGLEGGTGTIRVLVMLR